MKILRGGSENVQTPKRETLKKIVGLGGRSPKICIFQNQQEGGLLKN